jgi:membrane-bound lytic murein transglycosylase B
MAKHLARGGRHADRSRTRFRRVNRSAVRLTACSLLLPVPVAAAVQPTSLADEVLGLASAPVPAASAGSPRSGVLPVTVLKAARAAEKNGPSASLTKVSRREQAQAFRASEVAANGVPQAALRAYRTAEATMAIADPSCELSWALLAGIGRVESDHGRYAGSVLGRDGVSDPEILGLPLNGVGPVAAIADTDAGSLDGDKVWDRAVGPMQFIPSTWAMVGVDGDGDNNRNPHDLDDAALAAAAYLCVGDNDLSTTAGMQQAVYSYNHSAEYVTLVLGLAEAYQKGLVDLPALAASPLSGLATGPGVDVGLNEGRGVPIGASDDVAGKRHSDEKGAAEDGRDGDRADDTADWRSGGRHRAEHPDRGGGRAERPRHGDDTAPHDRRRDDGDHQQETDRPKPGKHVKDDGAPQQPATPTPAPTPEPLQKSETGTLAYCDDTKAALCLDGRPLEGEVVFEDFADLVGVAVIVTYQFDDEGQTWFVTALGPVAE